MTVTALTGIAQLVTNDPTHEYAEAASGPLGVILDAAVVMDGGRVRWTSPEVPIASSTWAGGPWCPASSTVTTTSPSPATGRRSSRPA
jgi:hypothetical protein